MRALRIPRFYTKCLHVELWLDTLTYINQHAEFTFTFNHHTYIIVTDNIHRASGSGRASGSLN